MALATWWITDAQPRLQTLHGFVTASAQDDEILAGINGIPREEVQNRRRNGHRPYIAYMNGVPAAYGWVATRKASIGELQLDFAIPLDQRYLWDFATLADWQGYGIYPRLLQAILYAELSTASRFWIIYAPENLPSGVGMQKAGFSLVGQLSFRRDGSVALVPLKGAERAREGANLLGVPCDMAEVSPCWRCIEKLVCSCQYDPEQCICAVDVKPSAQRRSSAQGR
jgi:hypothetical protein